MAIVLTQQYHANDPACEDAEFSLYHYPRIYFGRIRANDRFVYYRPRANSAGRPDASHYFGHGILGQPFDDPRRPDHRFVPLIESEPFENLVALRDMNDLFYETAAELQPQFHAAIRRLTEIAHRRILQAAGVLRS